MSASEEEEEGGEQALKESVQISGCVSDRSQHTFNGS